MSKESRKKIAQAAPLLASNYESVRLLPRLSEVRDIERENLRGVAIALRVLRDKGVDYGSLVYRSGKRE